MPPRKRTTRINTRAKPKAPVGDEGKSLTEMERQMKLKTFLEDYDAKVAAHIKAMEEKKNYLSNMVTSRLKSELMQLPEAVRKMTMKEFIEAGGTHESAIESMDQGHTTSRSVNCPVSSKLVRTISLRRPNILSETILEETSSPTPSQSRKRAAANRTTARKQQLLQESSVYRPQSVLNSALRARYQTPQLQRGTMGLTEWDTPLITPKFNPKLPYTPAGAREPRPGERLMSMTGSPIANPADSSVKVTDKGLSLHINNFDDLDNVDLDIPEEQVRKVMAMFKNIMKKAKQ